MQIELYLIHSYNTNTIHLHSFIETITANPSLFISITIHCTTTSTDSSTTCWINGGFTLTQFNYSANWTNIHLLSSLLLASLTTALASTNKNKQWYGHLPISSVPSYLGATLNYNTAKRICCNNHCFAECAGCIKAPEVNLFGCLDPNKEMIFYNSVCRLPLFIALRGRTF